MKDSSNPYFLEVIVEKEENVFPMIPTGIESYRKITNPSFNNRISEMLSC